MILRYFKYRIVFLIFSSMMALLAPKSAQGQLFRVVEEEREISVPFQMYGELIIVDIIIDRLIPMKFIFDTGAENTLLFDKKYSDYLGFKYERKIPVYGSNLDSTVNALITRKVELQLIGLPVLKTDILVLESAPEGIRHSLGKEIHGILGAHFFGSVPFKIDYRRREIRFIHPEDWVHKPKSKYDILPLQMNDRKPYCEISFSTDSSSTENLLFLLDTGASLGVLVHQNTSPEVSVPVGAAEGVLGYGISGYLTGFLSRLKTLEFGRHQFSEIIVAFQKLDIRKLDTTDISRNGIIGNKMLKKFDLIFDYTSSRLYLKPNKYYAREQKFDKSGMVLGAFGPDLKDYTIIQVIDGSPADLAGLKRGDTIKRIGLLPASAYELDRLLRKFKGRNGKKICLKMSRGGKKYKTQMILKSLL